MQHFRLYAGEISYLNLGRQTEYYYRNLLCVYSVPQVNFVTVPKIGGAKSWMSSRKGDNFFFYLSAQHLSGAFFVSRLRRLEFLSVSRGFWKNLWNPSVKLFHYFKSCIPYYPIIRWYIIRLTDSVVKYTTKVNYRKQIFIPVPVKCNSVTV